MITDNYNYLAKINYLTNAEKAFFMDLVPYVEFKTNILVERANEENEFDSDNVTPSYLAKELKRDRSRVSMMMNSLMEKGVLAVAESGMTIGDGLICTSRTCFVNPNIMCFFHFFIGWSNRGAKQCTDLYALNSTKAPAILVELGFIDNDSDMAKWDIDNISNSIVYALTGQTVGGSQTHQPHRLIKNVML